MSNDGKHDYSPRHGGHSYHYDNASTVLTHAYPLIAEADARLPGRRRWITVSEKTVSEFFDEYGRHREPRREYVIRDYEIKTELLERFQKGEATIAWEETENRLVIEDIDSKSDCEYILFGMLGDLHRLRPRRPGDAAF